MATAEKHSTRGNDKETRIMDKAQIRKIKANAPALHGNESTGAGGGGNQCASACGEVSRMSTGSGKFDFFWKNIVPLLCTWCQVF
jgi:hypothetical protein